LTEAVPSLTGDTRFLSFKPTLDEAYETSIDEEPFKPIVSYSSPDP
jgi:hypothetical protein